MLEATDDFFLLFFLNHKFFYVGYKNYNRSFSMMMIIIIIVSLMKPQTRTKIAAEAENFFVFFFSMSGKIESGGGCGWLLMVV